jgi:hypothetical protein
VSEGHWASSRLELQALSMSEADRRGLRLVLEKSAGEAKRRNRTDNDCMGATCDGWVPPLLLARWIGIFYVHVELMILSSNYYYHINF